MEKPYRIKHKASGLYYQPAINHSNLSKKGKVYMTNNSLLMSSSKRKSRIFLEITMWTERRNSLWLNCYLTFFFFLVRLL